MAILLNLAAFLGLAAALPSVARDDWPLQGSLRVNVVTQSNVAVGCLDSVMQFTADTTACAAFDFKTYTFTDPNFPFVTRETNATSSAGLCGSPVVSGTRVLTCGSAVTADTSDFTLDNGTDGLDGQLLLVQPYDSTDGFKTIDGSVPTGTEAKTLKVDLDDGSAGESYSLTFTSA